MEMTKLDRIQRFREISPLHDSLTEGIISVLDEMNFFTSPASTKYHGSYEGGLFDHCLNVYIHLKRLTSSMCLTWQNDRSPFIIAFLHDLCKSDQYIEVMGDRYKYNESTLLNGHGSKSVMLCNQLPIHLTEEEMVCILYHMGAFTEKTEWTYYTNAIHRYPNVLWTHTADMMAAHLTEVRNDG